MPPYRFGDRTPQAGYPAVLTDARAVYLVWKEFDGERARILLATSHDGGSTWSQPRMLADAAGATDHPVLIRGAGKVYLSWNTADSGLRVLEVEP